MKVVILAGGFGTRLSEETAKMPKPLVEIGGKPIIWHIMKYYAHYGFDDFVIALGYMGDKLKRYFLDYDYLSSDFSIDMANGTIQKLNAKKEKWKVHLVDTGLDTMTGGRLLRLKPFIGQETFMMTYGDGLCNVDLKKLHEFHKAHGKKATVTAVRPQARFGGMKFENHRVTKFAEKLQADEGWINGGFFVLEPSVLESIQNDTTVWEREPLESMVAASELMAYEHEGFWHCMDTLRDKKSLEDLWTSKNTPWQVWS